MCEDIDGSYEEAEQCNELEMQQFYYCPASKPCSYTLHFVSYPFSIVMRQPPFYDYILMLNISEAKRLLEECVAKNGIKLTSGHNYYLDLELEQTAGVFSVFLYYF